MAIDFGYFTLDNYYPDNPRSSSDFVLEIREQAILADKLGYSSAGSANTTSTPRRQSRPDILLASIIPETQNIRSRLRSTSCRCTTPSTSRKPGRRSTCYPAVASISPPAAATTRRNTCPSAPIS